MELMETNFEYNTDILSYMCWQTVAFLHIQPLWRKSQTSTKSASLLLSKPGSIMFLTDQHGNTAFPPSAFVWPLICWKYLIYSNTLSHKLLFQPQNLAFGPWVMCLILRLGQNMKNESLPAVNLKLNDLTINPDTNHLHCPSCRERLYRHIGSGFAEFKSLAWSFLMFNLVTDRMLPYISLVKQLMTITLQLN